MKKIFLSLFALASIVATANAQVDRKTDANKPDRKEWKEGRGERGKHGDMHHNGEAFKQLNLSEDQQQKMKSLNEEFRTKMQSLHKNDGITVKDAKAQREALVKQHQASIQALLTSEQRSKLEQIKVEEKSKRNSEGNRNDKADRHDGARADKMKSELNLTDAQVAQMNANREKLKAEFKAIKDDQSLSKEQKKAKLEALRNQQKDSFKSILTQEQQKKMEESKANRPERRKGK